MEQRNNKLRRMSDEALAELKEVYHFAEALPDLDDPDVITKVMHLSMGALVRAKKLLDHILIDDSSYADVKEVVYYAAVYALFVQCAARRSLEEMVQDKGGFSMCEEAAHDFIYSHSEKVRNQLGKIVPDSSTFRELDCVFPTWRGYDDK